MATLNIWMPSKTSILITPAAENDLVNICPQPLDGDRVLGEQCIIHSLRSPLQLISLYITHQEQ